MVGGHLASAIQSLVSEFKKIEGAIAQAAQHIRVSAAESEQQLVKGAEGSAKALASISNVLQQQLEHLVTTVVQDISGATSAVANQIKSINLPLNEINEAVAQAAQHIRAGAAESEQQLIKGAEGSAKTLVSVSNVLQQQLQHLVTTVTQDVSGATSAVADRIRSINLPLNEINGAAAKFATDISHTTGEISKGMDELNDEVARAKELGASLGPLLVAAVSEVKLFTDRLKDGTNELADSILQSQGNFDSQQDALSALSEVLPSITGGLNALSQSLSQVSEGTTTLAREVSSHINALKNDLAASREATIEVHKHLIDTATLILTEIK